MDVKKQSRLKIIGLGDEFESRIGLVGSMAARRETVIIDVLSHFSDPESQAHFILVTGISTDPDRDHAILIQCNDPLTGTKEADDWSGDAGVWHAWQNNGDPGGPGWWMVISP